MQTLVLTKRKKKHTVLNIFLSSHIFRQDLPCQPSPYYLQISRTSYNFFLSSHVFGYFFMFILNLLNQLDHIILNFSKIYLKFKLNNNSNRKISIITNKT